MHTRRPCGHPCLRWRQRARESTLTTALTSSVAVPCDASVPSCGGDRTRLLLRRHLCRCLGRLGLGLRRLGLRLRRLGLRLRRLGLRLRRLGLRLRRLGLRLRRLVASASAALGRGSTSCVHEQRDTKLLQWSENCWGTSVGRDARSLGISLVVHDVTTSGRTDSGSKFPAEFPEIWIRANTFGCHTLAAVTSVRNPNLAPVPNRAIRPKRVSVQPSKLNCEVHPKKKSDCGILMTSYLS